jgi:hypothetical protein
MERRIRGVFVLLAAAGLATAMERRAGASVLITFNNTDTTAEQALYPGYGGLVWQNVQTMNTDWWVKSGEVINGYVNGAVAPPIIAWVPPDAALSNTATAAISSGTPFSLESAALTSAWNDNLQLQVTGYLNGQIVGSQSVTLNPSGPTIVNFNFPQVDTIRMVASGGTYDPAFPVPEGSSGLSLPPSPQFVIGDLTVDGPGFTPEPSPPPVPEPSCFGIAGVLIVG